MHKKGIIILLCAALVIGVITGVSIWYYHKTNIKINDTVYARDITELNIADTQSPEIDRICQLSGLKRLDIRNCGIGFEDYDKLKAALPDCDILWSVPFQGQFLDSTTTELTLSEISDQDLAQLKYFPALQRVDANGCQEHGKIMALVQQYPDLAVSYHVLLDGQKISNDMTDLTVQDVDIPKLTAVLPYLPEMKNISLEGTLPAAEELQKLCADFPGIAFYWQIELFGITADVNTEELDFSDIKMESVEQVESALGYLPGLKKVVMCNCGISNEDMDALWKRNPDVRFIWSVKVGSFTLRTDVTSFMPGKYHMLPYGNQCYNLRYCVDMECLDLGHCKINDCDFVAYMPNLKYLLLALTDITDISPIANHDQLIYLELFTNKQLKDYTPLLTLTALEDLNICYTNGDIEIIAQMTWLKNLWWSAGPDNTAVIKQRTEILSERLPNTYLELDTFSSTGEGWRQLPNYYAQRDIFEMPYFTY